MQRQQLAFLKQWIQGSKRKPLIIRGARQVGKSTLVELFAAQQGMTLLSVNLERYPSLASAFASNDPEKILQQIEVLPRMPALDSQSLLFLDEIQAIPEAIPALRYFYEEQPQLPLVCAGSLLEFVLTAHQFSMPVGRVQYLHMPPMTFSEFLLALGETKLHEIISGYAWGDDIGAVAHQRLLELLRSYYFVGGMPEAVATFAETRRYQPVSAVHQSIVDTYRDDFPKYAKYRDHKRMLDVFNFAARHVGVKVKYSNISREDQSAALKKDLELLCMAKVISKVTHSHCSGLPLQANLDEKVYKLLFLDVGLMNAICGLNWHALSQWDELRLVNEGSVAEQFIGQHLQALLAESPNRELAYWLREGRTGNAEVDFVVAVNGQIIPIEVKAGASGSMKSLHQFMAEKRAPYAIRFDTNLPTVSTINTQINAHSQITTVNYRLVSLPLYLVERLNMLAFPV